MSYSLLLLLRRFLLRGRIHEMIQDCLFGPIWSLLYFYRSYQYNCGITRWYMVAGVILGCIWRRYYVNCEIKETTVVPDLQIVVDYFT